MDWTTTGLHPVTRDWFLETFGTPSDVQRQTWPAIRQGEHVLATAPTGSGKTLAAFLSVIDRLCRGELPRGRTSVLYVSPLKALNNDIERNLRAPLAALQARFPAMDSPLPAVRVTVRSGDTPASERRALFRQPPDVLITTPESLHVLITQPKALALLADLDTVIVDEIHALCDSPRGLLLQSALERLTCANGEFQRVALSATVTPLDAVGDWLAGWRQQPDGDWRRRPVRLIEGRDDKQLALAIAPIHIATDTGEDPLGPLAARLAERLARPGSRLVFTNSRRMCERLAHLVNVEAGERIAYAHHGSLDRSLRLEVEQRLKAGELRAIVATSSMEMGIDVGALEEVLLIQSPDSVSSTLQRLGRAGHDLRRTSRALLYPTHLRDALVAAALAGLVQHRSIEPTRIMAGALDVLAQVIVAWCGAGEWSLDALHDGLRRTSAWHGLPRHDFDAVVALLAGRSGDRRLRELAPLCDLDSTRGRLALRKGALPALYMSGGVIPDRGYYQLRLADGDHRIGELDEEFVWEARRGQVFSLGNRNWRIREITRNDVRVEPAGAGRPAPPFWRSDDRIGNTHLHGAVLDLLDRAEGDLAAGRPVVSWLVDTHDLDPALAANLQDFLMGQREFTGAALPGRSHVLIETVDAAPDGSAPGHVRQWVMHTERGAAINRPLALVLETLARQLGSPCSEAFADDATIVLHLADPDIGPGLLPALLDADVTALLQAALPATNAFGRHFREAAGHALLLRRRRFGERMPLWVTRLRADELLHRTRELTDFPVIRAAVRATLDSWDVTGLDALLTGLRDGSIRVTRRTGNLPGPLARSLAWDQVNAFIYRDDTPSPPGPVAGVDPALIAMIRDDDLRRPLLPAAIAGWRQSRQRLQPDHAPQDAAALADWLYERVLVDPSQWAALQTARRAAGFDDDAQALLAGRMRRIGSDGADWLIATDRLPALSPLERLAPVAAAHTDANAAPDETRLERLMATLLEWLADQGPVPVEALATRLPLTGRECTQLSELLSAEECVIRGRLVRGDAAEQLCHIDSYELILRRQTREGSVTTPILPLPTWQARLAAGLRPTDGGASGPAVPSLTLWPTTPALLAGALCATRMGPNDTAARWLDRHGLIIRGVGERRLTVCLPEDEDLLPTPPGAAPVLASFTDPDAWYAFGDIADRAGSTPEALIEAFWQAFFDGDLEPDGWAGVAGGLATGFRATGRAATPDRRPDPNDRSGQRLRRARQRAREQIRQRFEAVPGLWRRVVPAGEPDPDPLTRHELDAARVQLLLARYGVICREVLALELPAQRWSVLLGTLRRLELTGELLRGRFVEGPAGPQYTSVEALARLGRQAAPAAALCTADPVSLCGRQLQGTLPGRGRSRWLLTDASDLIGSLDGESLRLDCPLDRATAALQALALCLRTDGGRISQLGDTPLTRAQAERISQQVTELEVERDHRGVRLLARAADPSRQG